MSTSREDKKRFCRCHPFLERHSQTALGFTMLEMVLSMTILSLLVVAMMTLVEKTLESTTLLEQVQQRREQREGIVDLLRATFRMLPNETQMISRRVDNSTIGTQQQIVFGNAPTLFAWGSPDEMIRSSVILGVTDAVGGSANLCIKREPPPNMEIRGNPRIDYISLLPQEGSSDDTAKWLTLLENIKFLQWRFFDPRTMSWLDDWTDQNSRPTLVEFNIQYLDDDTIQRYVFWIPPMTVNSLPNFGGRARSSGGTSEGGGNTRSADTP